MNYRQKKTQILIPFFVEEEDDRQTIESHPLLVDTVWQFLRCCEIFAEEGIKITPKHWSAQFMLVCKKLQRKHSLKIIFLESYRYDVLQTAIYFEYEHQSEAENAIEALHRVFDLDRIARQY